ncbi:ABC transporter ATP-binding protein [Metamycoplasma neophronis]|uniref:ABC transporter ATP-binding protein n=1 Tax=Metamycoplasma neophronis TaxID=872983 RepID=A0ABY2Z1Z3_9BACT|nr:ABC transporter ATP-binding protein [Metamycoplasma neophronis]TPR53900.1 ABC transporter ATP-binding protein [Metamycoplasma neophronis]
MYNLDPLKSDKKVKEMNALERKAFFKKQKAIKSDSFKKLIKYLNYRRGIVFAIILTTFISAMLGAFGVYLMGYIMNHYFVPSFLTQNYDAGIFAGAIAGLIATYVLVQIFSYLSNDLSVRAGVLTAAVMRNDAYKAIMKMPISFFDSVNSGELMSILTNDIDNISNGLSGSLNAIISTIFTVLTSLGFMLYYSVYLTLIVIALLPIFFGFAFIMMKKAIPQYAKTQKRIATLNGYIEEHLAAHHIIKSYDRNNMINDQFEIRNKKLFKSTYKASIYSGVIWPYANAVTNILQLIVLAIASGFALAGIGTGSNSVFDAGVIASFIMYIRIMSNQIVRTFENLAAIQTASVSASRAFAVINLKPEINEEILGQIDNVKGNVEFKDVSFSYDKNSDKLQLKNASFKAKKGEVFAIVGPTGAGKTTIINLLSKFYLPNSGEILIDGHKSSEINEHSWRNQMSIVLQDTFLFKTTIMENLKYANSEATEEEIMKAAKISNAADFIEQLRDGYNTVVEEGGSNFSQGERQLLAITRAIIANKNILILDEATSNVDTMTEKKIQDAMMNLMKGKTSFVIAHRLSTIVNADQILVIKDGEIIERGNHKELLAQGGFYEKLYHSSFYEDA